MKALIVVDMLEEFVDGRLGSDKARAIVPNIAALANAYSAAGGLVVFANDAHQPGDPEMELWGEHAIHGTPEAGLATDLLVALDTRGKTWVHHKSEYDAFAPGGPNAYASLTDILRGHGVTDVTIVGVATHICVAQTAIGAFQNGFNVTVVADAVAGFEDTDEAFWLRHIRELAGANVPFTADAIAGLEVPA